MGRSLPRRRAGTDCCTLCTVAEKHKLSGEQDFMVSMVPMLAVSAMIAATQPVGTVFDQFPAGMMGSREGQVAVAAGVAYGVGYLALLKAWELVPSTVIVPCLQLSSPLVVLLAAGMAPWHAADPLLADAIQRGASRCQALLARVRTREVTTI